MLKHQIKQVQSWFHKLYFSMEENTAGSQIQMLSFGIFGVINYPVFYVVWLYVFHEGYESFTVRFTAALLCLGLVLKNYWPQKLKPFLPIYWYLTLTYCLPFLGTFMLLQNSESTAWLTNAMLALVLLILLVDWISLVILLLIGAASGWLTYYLITGNFGSVDSGSLSNYVFAVVIAMLFSRNRQVLEKAKLRSACAIGANIAHEMRTPINTVKASFKGIKRYFSAILQGYQLAKEAGLPVEPIHPGHYKTLLTTLDTASNEIQYSHTLMDILLMNVRQANLKSEKIEICSMAACIKEALERYPFSSEGQAKKVHWDNSQDFQFKGVQLLVVHMLFNLIKNALFYIGAAQKGEIYLSMEEGKRYNTLYFKDTGAGMSSAVQSKLFTRFFTTSTNGTGLGLAFCKMVMEELGGKILCDSQEDEYTQFTLLFPKVE